jgi:NTP pyrophosphatase (non-canonical NTP hydrolase)
LADRYGGWGIDQNMFMKLVEEIGEVAEVMNKMAGRKANDEEDLKEHLGIELADMLHYTLAIAALNNIDMERIILEKDKKASIKYNHNINLEQFLQSRGGQI